MPSPTAGRDITNRAVSLLPSPSQEPTVEVPLTSLDQLLQESGAPPPAGVEGGCGGL
jgi:hypothetical protein